MEKIQEAFWPLSHLLKRTRKFEPTGIEIRIQKKNKGTEQMSRVAGQTNKARATIVPSQDCTTLPKSSCRVHDRTEQEELNRHIMVHYITAQYSNVYDCPVDVAVQVCGYDILRAKTRA